MESFIYLAHKLEIQPKFKQCALKKSKSAIFVMHNVNVTLHSLTDFVGCRWCPVRLRVIAHFRDSRRQEADVRYGIVIGDQCLCQSCIFVTYPMVNVEILSTKKFSCKDDINQVHSYHMQIHSRAFVVWVMFIGEQLVGFKNLTCASLKKVPS